MTTPEQLTAADLIEMDPTAIDAARREGRLVDLMSGTAPDADDDDEADDAERPEDLEDEHDGGGDAGRFTGMKPNPAQGAMGSLEAEHAPRTAAGLSGLSHEQINRLRREGKLDALMGRPRR